MRTFRRPAKGLHACFTVYRDDNKDDKLLSCLVHYANTYGFPPRNRVAARSRRFNRNRIVSAPVFLLYRVDRGHFLVLKNHNANSIGDIDSVILSAYYTQCVP